MPCTSHGHPLTRTCPRAGQPPSKARQRCPYTHIGMIRKPAETLDDQRCANQQPGLPADEVLHLTAVHVRFRHPRLTSAEVRNST